VQKNGRTDRDAVWEADSFGVPALSYDVVCVILGLAFTVQHRLVTDGRTDGRTDRQTHDDGKYRGSIASHGKNCFSEHGPIHL